MTRNISFAASVIGAAAVLYMNPAQAVLSMTLSGSAESSIVTVNFTGSADVNKFRFKDGDSLITNGLGWDMSPTKFDPFPESISKENLGRMYFTSGNAWISNASTGFYSTLNRVFLQDSSNSPVPGFERFGAISDINFSVALGNHVTWGGSATFDLATVGLVFGDLRLGSSGIVGTEKSAPFSLPGRLTVSLVPEPSTAVLLFGGVLAFLAFRKSRGQF